MDMNYEKLLCMNSCRKLAERYSLQNLTCIFELINREHYSQHPKHHVKGNSVFTGIKG